MMTVWQDMYQGVVSSLILCSTMLYYGQNLPNSEYKYSELVTSLSVLATNDGLPAIQIGRVAREGKPNPTGVMREQPLKRSKR